VKKDGTPGVGFVVFVFALICGFCGLGGSGEDEARTVDAEPSRYSQEDDSEPVPTPAPSPAPPPASNLVDPMTGDRFVPGQGYVREAQSSYQQETQGYTVYITRTGRRYHSGGCSSLRSSSIQISLSDARSQGYTACARCGG
jgi:hypothetical protein